MPEFCTPVSESLGSASTKMHIRISMFFKFTNSNQQFLQLKNAADIGLPDAGLPEVGLEVGLPNVENLLRSKNWKWKKIQIINYCPNIMPGPRVERTCRTEHVHTHDCQLWFPFKNKGFAACRLKVFADRHEARRNWQNWRVFPTTVHYQILIIWYFRVLHPNVPYWCQAEKYPEYPTWPPS